MPQKYTEKKKSVIENGTQQILIELAFQSAKAERQNYKHTLPLTAKALTLL